MGIKERRERERLEVRGAILEAAREIAVQDGWQALTIRKVADAVEYSPPVLYDHFASKEAILRQLALDGFEKLLGRLRASGEGIREPEEKMVQLALAYCSFARDYPELYQVMHGMSGVSCSLDAPVPAQTGIGHILATTVSAVLPGLSDGDRLAAMTIHWATLHGLVALAMEGRLPVPREQLEALVEQSVRTWIAGWR